MLKPKKPEIGVWKTVESKGRHKQQKEKPKPVLGELPAKSREQNHVASRPKNSKQLKSVPRERFRNQNRQWSNSHISMPFSSYGSPLYVPCEANFNMHYFCPPWSFNSMMSFAPRYFYPDYITSREPTIIESSSKHNDRFDQKNRPIQRNKRKVVKQVYRVKKDGRLNKNSDLTLDIEKPNVEESSADSIDEIALNDEHVSKNIAEQKSSSAGGQGKSKKSVSTTGGLTACASGLTACSREAGNPPKLQEKVRPSFEELMAKYKKKGAVQKRRNPPRHGKRQGMHQQQYNNGFVPYSFAGSVLPWSWSYPCYFSPLDYDHSYMQPYIVQYSPPCPNYGSMHRPIVASNNLDKSASMGHKAYEKDSKGGAKSPQPRWCPSGLSRTQKRRLQRMRKQESMEQHAEEKLARSAATKQGPISNDTSHKRFFSIAPPAVLIFFVLIFVAGAIVTLDHKENLSILKLQPKEAFATEEIRTPATSEEIRTPATSELRSEPTEEPNICENQCRPPGSEALPRGIVHDKSNFEMDSLGGDPERKQDGRPSKSLLAIPVGIKQKAVVDKLVSKFPAANFIVMLFHYDGEVDGWRDLKWSDRAIHVAVRDQTKWWFAKRFLHPDLVSEYEHIFLWDEDIEVDSFDPLEYLRIVRREGLDISQPALDRRSQIHHRLTARGRKGDVHRRFYKTNGHGRCYDNSTGPPCTGWVEMMVPVFSRAAWRCAWHMIQNDLIYAWGLDFKLGYCAQGDRRRNVGVVDSQFVLHRGIPTLGDGGGKAPQESRSTSTTDRLAVRQRSYTELKVFNRRWKDAVAEDGCWTDPYPNPATTD